MRVFISWSKEPSRTVAAALRDWLPDVIQSLEPWMSSSDIGAGARWSPKIAAALASTKIGILCVTQENQREPWLLFEAGALAKTVDDTFVCPYLIQMRDADLAQGPLTQFQAKLADRDGTLELLATINAALGTDALSTERLQRSFDRSWPGLEGKLKALPTSAPGVRRPDGEILTDILDTVRSLARRMSPAPTPPDAERDFLERFVVHRLRRVNVAAFRNLKKLPDEDLRDLYQALSRPDVRGATTEWARQKLMSTPPPEATQSNDPPAP